METHYERELREAGERGKTLPNSPLVQSIQETIVSGWQTLVSGEREDARRREQWQTWIKKGG